MKEKAMERITSSKIVRVAMAMALVLSVVIVPAKAYASGDVSVSIGKNLPYAGYATTQMSANGNDAYCIEPSLGVDRMLLAFLCDAYDEEVVDAEKNDTRVVLHLHPALAPFKACVLPLSKKLSEEATALYQELSDHFMVDYDEAGSIGKRYRRQDEIGTPFCITYDFESKEDGCVTVRDRDTMAQERVPMKDLVHYLIKKVRF